MAKLQKSGSIKRKPLQRGKYLNRKGPKATLWDDFRAKKLRNDQDEEGLITCQDWKLGLPRCEQRSSSPDLHHILGRDDRPDLYFANPNLAWLVRKCHDAAHELSKSGILTENDKIKNSDRNTAARLPANEERLEDSQKLRIMRANSSRTFGKERVYD